MSRGSRRAVAAALTTAVAALALSGPAISAPESPSWSASPATVDGKVSNRPYLVYEVEAGTTLRDQVLVTNNGSAALTLRTYGTDAHSDDAGRFALLTAAETPTGLGTWLRLATPEVVVPAGSSHLVPVRIKVPANALPGDHVGGVITSTGRAVTDTDGERVLLDTRIAVRVHVRVTGPALAGLETTGLEAVRDSGNWWNPFDDKVRIRYRAANTGAVRLNVRHEIVAQGALGLELGQRAGTPLPDLLPGADVKLGHGTPTGADVSAVDLAAPVGGVDVEVTVRATDRVTGEALPHQVLTTEVDASPWVWVGWVAMLGAVGLVAVLLRRGVRRVRRPR